MLNDWTFRVNMRELQFLLFGFLLAWLSAPQVPEHVIKNGFIFSALALFAVTVVRIINYTKTVN